MELKSRESWDASILHFSGFPNGKSNQNHTEPLSKLWSILLLFSMNSLCIHRHPQMHSTSRALPSHVACFGGFDPQKWSSKQQEPGSSKALGMWTPTNQTLEKWYFDDLSSDTSLFRFQRHQTKNFSLSGLGPSHLDFDLIRGGNGGGGSSCGCGNINSIRWVLIVQLISVSFSFVVELFRGFLKCCWFFSLCCLEKNCCWIAFSNHRKSVFGNQKSKAFIQFPHLRLASAAWSQESRKWNRMYLPKQQC